MKRHAELDAQIVANPGWQSNMMHTAGFGPVHMAVNCRGGKILECLLEAGAAASLYTGPLNDGGLLVSVTGCIDVYEYGYNGRCTWPASYPNPTRRRTWPTAR